MVDGIAIVEWDGQVLGGTKILGSGPIDGCVEGATEVDGALETVALGEVDGCVVGNVVDVCTVGCAVAWGGAAVAESAGDDSISTGSLSRAWGFFDGWSGLSAEGSPATAPPPEPGEAERIAM